MQRMTLQDVFTKAVIGFRKQNYVRSNHGGRCLYRGPNDTRCLIGHAIPDDKFDPRWDRRDGGVIFSCHYFDNFRALFVEDIDFVALSTLQRIHDSGYIFNDHSDENRAEAYEDCFRKFATRYHLEMPA